jgi:Flp pilus assembly protein TadG
MKSNFVPRSLRRSSRNGSAMVEVAVCFPVFLMVLMGMIEFGRAMSINQLLNSSARIGCRASILDGSTNDAVSSTVKTHVANTVGCSTSSVTVAITVTDGDTGAALTNVSEADTSDVITINVSVPFSHVSWAVNRYLTTASVRGQCSMQHE